MSNYNKCNANLIHTKDNRGYVYVSELCLVCDLTEHFQIKKVIRTALKSEVHYLRHNSMRITLDQPLVNYNPGNWVFTHLHAHNGRVKITLQRRTRSVTLSLVNMHEGIDVQIVDIEGCIKPFYLPGMKKMGYKCTLERYLEFIHPTRILSDNNPHYQPAK